jgi:hypothetical protein
MSRSWKFSVSLNPCCEIHAIHDTGAGFARKLDRSVTAQLLPKQPNDLQVSRASVSLFLEAKSSAGRLIRDSFIILGGTQINYHRVMKATNVGHFRGVDRMACGSHPRGGI